MSARSANNDIETRRRIEGRGRLAPSADALTIWIHVFIPNVYTTIKVAMNVIRYVVLALAS